MVSIHVDATTVAGAGELSYYWRKDGVTILPGGNYAGTSSSTLMILSLDQAAIGEYDVVVINTCGWKTSTAANVTIGLECGSLADVASDSSDTSRNPNNSVGPEDLEAFVNGFIAENAAIADVASDSSDTTYNPSNSVGPEDLEAFVNSYIAGC